MQCLLLLFACFVSPLYASDDVKFYESFDETFEGRWIASEKPDYTGVWKHAKSEGHDDYGLLVSEKAKKYAIVKELDEPVILKNKTVVLQFEVRLQNGLECGGAYLKFLQPQGAGWNPKEFDDESPYTIMFGPDKCGNTNTVHFISRHKNPKTGKFVEHRLKFTPAVPRDNLTHVYTAVLKPNNQVRILMDGQEQQKGSFLSEIDFKPPLIPPKTIPDPDDKMPEDWDERAKIPDPDAKKPDDWDEDAPMEIEDEEAVKPEGWLDDEPREIDDPDAEKPDDWDDEADGEWEMPKIENPQCADAPGCGEWKRPKKKNPAYKGKWQPPLIDNSNYKGIWEPRKIDNPEYFELDKANLEPIAAVGIEIWTMQDGILFDNILIASSEKVARSYRKDVWKPKYKLEKQRWKYNQSTDSTDSDGLKGVQKVVFDYLRKAADLPFLGKRKAKVSDLLGEAEKQPNLTIGILASITVAVFSVLLKLIFGGKKPAAASAEAKKTDVAKTSNNKGSAEGNKERSKDAAAPRRRNARRDT